MEFQFPTEAMSEVLDSAFKRLASQRIQLLLETCDRALDNEACRADEAERRLESVRETLAAVRSQHEAIFNRYEELKSSMHQVEPPVQQKHTFNFAEPQIKNKTLVFSAPVHRPHGESVVQRMRAQLEESARKANAANSASLFGTPVARRVKTPAKLGTLSKNFL